MWEIQCWWPLWLNPNIPNRMRVTVVCTAARLWQYTSVLTRGMSNHESCWTESLSQQITSVALSGWGGIWEGKMVKKNSWGPNLQSANINYQKWLANTKTLSSSLQRTSHVDQERHHHCGGLYQQAGDLKFLRLHMLAHKLVIWSSKHFSVSKGHSCSRNAELCSRSSLCMQNGNSI